MKSKLELSNQGWLLLVTSHTALRARFRLTFMLYCDLRVFSMTNKKALLPAMIAVAIVLLATVSMQPAKAAGDFWVEKAPMPTANAYAEAVTIKGEIYVITPNSTYLYNPPTDTWSSKSSMPTVQFGFASCHLPKHDLHLWWMQRLQPNIRIPHKLYSSKQNV